ncbi:hypothetical protein [Metabacillus fastidiosus]|uniref:hypothetical protein n=1 Tax=Metabacillus fastidiosus TaxID=1458 RepID=UPI002E237C86|nr:hypothetical protein [Metabacillus fastidiosus]
MLKKASILSLGAIVALSPGITASAEDGLKEKQNEEIKEELVNTDSIIPVEETKEGEKSSGKAELKEESREDSERSKEKEETSEKLEINTEEVQQPSDNENNKEKSEEKEEDNEPEFIASDIQGTLSGSISAFNEKEGHYYLNVKVNITNRSLYDLEDTYVGFSLPKDIRVLEIGDASAFELFEGDNGANNLAIKLPRMKAGAAKEINVKVPVVGKTSAKAVNSSLELFVISPEGYVSLGKISGNANVNYANLKEEWHFNGVAQALTDFPGLPKNHFGMQFGFKLQNLTIEKVNNMKVEFIVPNGVKIHKPDQYEEADIPEALKEFLNRDSGDISESLTINWSGNTAKINIGSVDGGHTYQGFFSAVGESKLSLDTIKGLKVKITLNNGSKTVRELTVPIELVSYKGSSEKDNTVIPIKNSNTDSPVKQTGSSHNTSSTNTKSKTVEGGLLPKTASTYPLGALAGGMIAMLGAAILVIRKRFFYKV